MLGSGSSETVAADEIGVRAVEGDVGEKERPVRSLSRTDLERGFAKKLCSAMGYAMRLVVVEPI